MFRRTKSEKTTVTPPAAPDESSGQGGKGRPTPTRKEAEAAARARAKAALDPKASRKATRGAKTERSRQVREGIKAGDERYLGKRDAGPVRRFVRDFVDSRLNIAEFTIPLLFASLLFSSAGQPDIGNGLFNATIVIVTIDSVWLTIRLRRELKRRFPDQPTKGTTTYALARSLQFRFMRLPKPQVKLGQKLPDRY